MAMGQPKIGLSSSLSIFLCHAPPLQQKMFKKLPVHGKCVSTETLVVW
jgi:hypothetical protein